MKWGCQTTGLKRVIKALNDEIAMIEGATRKGLIKAGLIIEAESKKRCPRRFGNLINSGFTMWDGATFPAPNYSSGPDDDGELLSDEGFVLLRGGHSAAEMEVERLLKGQGMTVVVGHAAFYAWFVHEAGEGVNFTQGGPKFLQRALEENQDRIVDLIRREVEQ